MGNGAFGSAIESRRRAALGVVPVEVPWAEVQLPVVFAAPASAGGATVGAGVEAVEVELARPPVQAEAVSGEQSRVDDEELLDYEEGDDAVAAEEAPVGGKRQAGEEGEGAPARSSQRPSPRPSPLRE